MNKYKIVAIDDEEPSLKLIQWFIAKMDQLEFVAGFTSSKSAAEFLLNNPVDIVVLDIEMPEINGLDFAKGKYGKYKIIFSTAFATYAVDGFNLSASDYLLKPFQFERFKQAIDKVTHLIDLEKVTGHKFDLINVKVNYVDRPIHTSNIVYIESLNNNVSIHMEKGEILKFRDTLKRLMEELSVTDFVRIHRSYIVNRKFIQYFNKQRVSIGAIELPVGEKYKDDLVNFMRTRNTELT